MTIPPAIREAPRRIADMVREMVPHMRGGSLSKLEIDLAVHLRGNEPLYNALRGLIQSRIAGRAGIPEPSDPVTCKSIVARDRECQWLLSRLEAVYRAPVRQDSEHPNRAAEGG